VKAIILTGESDIRLWPLSRSNYPKQFLKFNGDTSLLQKDCKKTPEINACHNFLKKNLDGNTV